MSSRRSATILLAVLSLAIAGGCRDAGSGSTADRRSDTQTDDGGDTLGDLPDLGRPECDPLSRARCALPWPSHRFLTPDEDRKTGYVLDFGDETLPANLSGDHVAPSTYRRFDGYGVGTPIMVAFRNLDPEQLPGEREIADSMADDAPILLFRVAGNSLERVPYWAELDRRAEKGAERRMLIVRPAVILRENTRYIVAMRNLKREDGGAVEPSPAFRRLRAGRTEGLPRLERRRRRFEEIFGLLEGAGVERESLTLAWDFHTASCRSLHGSMLRIRNRGYRAVGAKGPKLTIEEVVEFSKEEDDQVAMRVEGSFRVPKFVEKTSIRDDEGLVLARDSQGRPVQRGWKESPFWLTIPRGAPGGKAHGLMQYGHGLLGTGEQVESGHNDRIAARHDLLVFGSTLFGMSSSDVEFALRALLDISKFPFMSDRLHQGMLEYLLLARAMRERLESTEFARKHDIDVDENQLYYSGISQGGIFGGTYMALSRDVRRGHLGVPGNNYTTLLERSVDFTRYFRVLNRAYENRLDQLLAQALLGILWEQTDPVSYLRHVRADPFPDTPRHDVLLAAAQGDHQVAPITNEVAVRTDVGIELMANYGRDVPLVEETSYPHTGSGLVLYSFGNPRAPRGNVPPTTGEDPHGEPRDRAWHNRQMVHFFRTGEIIDVCGDDGDPVCNPD